MQNPAQKAVNKMGGPALVGHVVGVSRQAVNSWFGDSGVPVYLIRAVSAASGVPLEEFMAFEEAKKGVNSKELAKRFKEALQDRDE